MKNSTQVISRKNYFGHLKQTFQLLGRGFKQHTFIYITGIIIPLLLYFIFIGYPIFETIVLSFEEWNGLDMLRTPVGFENYRELVQDPIFSLSLINNLKWAIFTLLFPVVLGLLLAVFLNSGNVYFPSSFRVIIFIPVTMSLVTVGVMWRFLLAPTFGGFNLTLQKIGLGSLVQDWLGNPDIVLYTLIVIFGWAYTGMALMLFHAGIIEIPEELFDAAKIEGANGWQTFINVTFPLLKPVSIVVVMLTIINSIKAFDLVMVMTSGGPFNSTSVLGYFMYKATFWDYRYGYGAAISIVILVFSSIFAAIYLKRVSGEAMYVS